MYFELCILDTVYEEVYWTENVNRLIGPKNVQKVYTEEESENSRFIKGEWHGLNRASSYYL